MKAPTQAQQLQQAVGDSGVELFHDPQHRGYATFPLNGHIETHPLRSPTFRRLLAFAYHQRFGGAVRREVIAEQLEILDAQALFEGPQEDVYVRLAPMDGGLILDLGGSDWSGIEIRTDGWRWRPSGSARLIRPPGLLQLPTPEPGGTLDALRPFVNVTDEDQWRLLIGFLIGCYHPAGPYPVLALHGEQGSAKSTVMRVLRNLIDPRDALDRTAPRDERDLAVHAVHNCVIALDNVSSLPGWLSDGLARLSTGAGYSTRQLYTDDAEITLHARRPIMLNAIASVVTRSDLLDRALIVNLEPISNERRQPEMAFWAAFHAAQPRILGALLDAVATALQRHEQVQLASLPRMADFARWVSAAEPALDWPRGAFMDTYFRNRGAAHELAIEADPVAGAVMAFMHARDEWEGTATDLLQELDVQVGDTVVRQREWPKAAHKLSNRLRRIAPNLRQIGISVETARPRGHARHVRIAKTDRMPSEASEAAASTGGSDPPETSDATDAAFAAESAHKGVGPDASELIAS